MYNSCKIPLKLLHYKGRKRYKVALRVISHTFPVSSVWSKQQNAKIARLRSQKQGHGITRSEKLRFAPKMGNLSTGTHNRFILLLRVSKVARTRVTQM